MKIAITLSSNSFNFEGEEADLAKEVFRMWLNAQQPGQDAIKLEELTQRLKTNNDSLASVVDQFGKGEQ